MSANGSNPNTLSQQQAQLSNAYVNPSELQQQPQPVDSQQPQYFQRSGFPIHATFHLPPNTIIQQMPHPRNPQHTLVETTFPAGLPQTSAYGGVNSYQSAYYPASSYYPHQFQNMAAGNQAQFVPQQQPQSFQQSQVHHQHYAQQPQQQPAQSTTSQTSYSSTQPAKPKKIIAISDPVTKEVINETVFKNNNAAPKTNPPAPSSTPGASSSANEEEKGSKARSNFIAEMSKISAEIVGTSNTTSKEPESALPESNSSTTTTNTTTTVEAGGAQTESTESKTAAADEDELVPGNQQHRSASIGVVPQPLKTQQPIRSGSTPKEVDATMIGQDSPDALSKAFSSKLNISSPKESTPPLSSSVPQSYSSSGSASHESSRCPELSETLKGDSHLNGSGRQSIENGSQSPSIVVSSDQSKPETTEDSPVKVRSPSLNGPHEDNLVENGKHADETPTENGVTIETEGPETKLKEFEDKMDELLQISEEADNVKAMVYSSNFLNLMRSIVKDLRHVKCPKSSAELEDIGIDRAGMPVTPSNKGFMRNTNAPNSLFTPSWQQTNTLQRPNKIGYSGRSSEKYRGMKKDPISGRSSLTKPRINEQILPKKSENAWKSRREEKGFDKNAEEVRYEKVKKEIRGLLNKITPSTYETMVEEFCDYKVHHDPKLLPMIIDLIFEKAVEEPRFCPLYSDLCKQQVDSEFKAPFDPPSEPGSSAPTSTVSFRQSIIQKCQQTFLSSNNSDQQIRTLEEELEAEADPTKKTALQEKIDLLKSKEKRRLLGIIKFIAQLYRHRLLIDSIINWCVMELVTRFTSTNDDVYIEYAVQMVGTVGPTYDKKRLQQQKQDQPNKPAGDEIAIDKIMLHFAQIKSVLSNRVRFMIMDLEELKRNNWQGRHGNTGPKTMEEVRNEAEQEQQENLQEREAYEKKKALGDYAKSKGRYLGRGSIESNSRPPPQSHERRSAAALASTQTGTGSAKKDMDLKKFDDQKLGRPSVWSRTTKVPDSKAPASSTPPAPTEPKEGSP